MSKKCLLKISEFTKKAYGADGSAPTRQTVASWCMSGQLPSEKIGKLWYIDWNAYQHQTGDDLVNKVLGG